MSYRSFRNCKYQRDWSPLLRLSGPHVCKGKVPVDSSADRDFKQSVADILYEKLIYLKVTKGNLYQIEFVLGVLLLQDLLKKYRIYFLKRGHYCCCFEGLLYNFFQRRDMKLLLLWLLLLLLLLGMFIYHMSLKIM